MHHTSPMSQTLWQILCVFHLKMLIEEIETQRGEAVSPKPPSQIGCQVAQTP